MIQIIEVAISRDALLRIAEERFGDMVKAVVDVARGVMAVGGELHADEETILLENGSSQSDLWGINIYPSLTSDEMVEFDSMINVRPRDGNRSRTVENPDLRNRILALVRSLVKDQEHA